MSELLKLKGDIKVMRMPTSKSGGAKFRGPTSSQGYNENEDLKYAELLELYKQTNELNITLKEAHQTVMMENLTLHNYVKILEDRMALIEKQLDTLSGPSIINKNFHKTAFVQDMKINYPKEFQNNQITIPRSEIDLQYRFATIPKIHQISKTHIVDINGKRIIPSELKVQVGRTSKKGKVIDNNILNAFNGDNLSFWRRTVTYDSPTDVPQNGEDVVLEIELPLHLVNNLHVNTIAIHPHPERGIQIKDIEMHYNDGWRTIQGFHQNEITSIASENHAPRKKWFFPSVPVQKIRITFVQNYSINVDGKTIFTLGAQEIGLFLTTFETSGGMLLTPFNMEGVYNIESVEHVFLNRGAFSYPKNMETQLNGAIYEYEVYVEDNDYTLRPLLNADWKNQIAERVWIKTHLHPDPYNGVNPCLHAVRLHYTKES
ncbi:hypothetical protein [Bacillus cereus]